MLAHMYAGEALLMMDRLTEARSYLEPSFVSTLNTFDFETKDWQVKSLDAAQNVMRYNLAITLSLQGEFDMARNLLVNCTHPLIASKVFILKVYIDKTQANLIAANVAAGAVTPSSGPGLMGQVMPQLPPGHM